jgi:hypothetical protein
MTDNGQILGLPVAHTPAENSAAAAPIGGADLDQERAAKVGSVKAMAQAALGDLVGQMTAREDEAEQASLMLDEADEQLALFRGPVRHVADQIDRSRKGPGRPKGSKNKASAEFAEVLQRMGYRHPGLNLAAMANAEPAALAIELGLLPDAPDGIEPHVWLRQLITEGKVTEPVARDLMDKAYGILGRANAELMPYFESKAPTKLNVDKKQVLGVMVIGDMTVGQQSERSTIDVTKVDAPI